MHAQSLQMGCGRHIRVRLNNRLASRMTSVRSLLLLLLSYIQISYSAHVVQSQQVLNLPAEGDDGKHHGSLGLLELHKQLVDIESISSNEHAVGDFLASYLAENGFKVETQPVGHGDRFNIWAWPGDEPGHSVLVTSHIDTVSGTRSLYGRSSC